MNGDIMEGLLLINGVDVWTEYGAWLAEDKEGETTNYSALQKPPAVKPQVAVNIREEDGEKLPEDLMQRWEPRDVTLKFAIAAESRAAFNTRRDSFISFLKKGLKGWLEISVPELDRTFRMYYRDCGSYTHLEDMGGSVAGMFSVKFREPKPEF